MEGYNITVECSCGKYRAIFDSTAAGTAEAAAEMHCLLGKGHVVRGYRPAHKKDRGIPVLLWTYKNYGDETNG